MSDVWSFGTIQDSTETYSDGTVVPHRYQDVLLNGVKVGYVEIHMHKRKGPDGVVDASVGVTSVTYGPLSQTGK